MNRTTCPYGMVDTCCENYNDCSLKDAEIKRQNEKIEFLARTNMLYSDWEHRNNQVTSDLIRKGIEEAKINAELRAEIERLKQREWVGLNHFDRTLLRTTYAPLKRLHHIKETKTDIVAEIVKGVS